MGYLHDGHASLMRAARAETDVVVASIFVNPLQFGPAEDLDAYPRDLDRRHRAWPPTPGVDLLFVPSVDEMYPRAGARRPCRWPRCRRRSRARSRPTHFAGVATVVAKLFAIVGPCRAYFGEKDFQQLAVVRRMAADLSMPVEVVGCPTVREPDGLAMSSRNVLPDARRAGRGAGRAPRRCRRGAAAIVAGERDPAAGARR